MQTLFTGRNIIELSECASVNTHAIELLKAVKLPEGTVIFTKKQTEGRGQRGNAWVSEHGLNITTSVVLHPNFLNVSNSFLLSMTVSLALHDLLTEILTKKTEIKIKWPNDLLIDGKKNAGILIENVLREEQIVSSVIGIGLNLNQENFGDLAEKAISIRNVMGREYDIRTTMEILFEKLEQRYLELRSGRKEKIKEDYLNNLWLFRQEHEYKIASGGKFSGRITGVNEDGKIRILSGEGTERKFEMKEIIF